MSDEEIIKRRLLIDSDGTGEDRRLNMLLKQFLKWTYSKNDSPENNQVLYDRLLAQMAQCQFAAAKNEYTSKMIEQELKNYGELSQYIEKSIEMAETEIAESKKQLTVAKQIRKNKMEYDMLAKVIKEQPDRKETAKQIEVLKRELADLIEKRLKLERKFQKRRNDFTLLMYAIYELQAQLEDDNTSEESGSEADDPVEVVEPENGIMDILSDEEQTEPNVSKAVKRRHDHRLEKLKKVKMEVEDTNGDTSVDEDTVLELSIDKDENEAPEVVPTEQEKPPII